MREIVRCASAIVGGTELTDFAFAVEDGTIGPTGNFSAVRAALPAYKVRAFDDDVVIVPGFINGHSHAYQILLRGWADDWTFAKWRSDALYRVIPQLRADDIYWTFVAAFTEMLAAGITSVVEFFYLNGDGNANAEAVIRAARDTGIRLVLARAWMDADYAPPAFRETIGQAQERTQALIAKYPAQNICIAPHSVHAASPEMIAAAMQCAQERDLLLHIHVAEAQYEVEETMKMHGATPVDFLDRLGVLNDRLIAVHAIYLSQEEKRLLAQRGARVVHNPMTNQYLGDGTCDLAGLLDLGVPVALGTDADVKPSLFDEMRAAALLQKLAARDGSILDARTSFNLATAGGARALGLKAGELASGCAADYLAVDASRIDPWSPALNALVYRAQDAWIRETYVNGELVSSGERSALAFEADEKLTQISHTLQF
ncbi:MAG: amidohydrolase family protein [Candidatus Eremiobacteraeota bacterium]|nr:amidohydrolase family protein [Candidatus Eremiobacteraeota bacterium]